MAGASGSTRLAQQIPLTAAAWLALTGEFIDAAEALRVHLVNKVVAREKLMEEVERVAGLIMRHPAIAVRVEMEALEYGRELDRAQLCDRRKTSTASSAWALRASARIRPHPPEAGGRKLT